MSDLYQGFTVVRDRQAAHQAARASPSPRSWSGTPRARRSSTAPSPSAAAAGWPSRWSGSSTPSASPRSSEPDADATYRGLVFDATGLTSSDQLVALRDFFTPLLRSLDRCPRVVVLGTPPEQVDRRRAGRPARARGLHPQPRQGDRPRRHRPARVRRRRRRGRGRTARSRSCSPPSRRTSPARWSGSARTAPRSPARSPTGPARSRARSRVVTGASRGIGEQIARVLHRDGATVVGVDVPQAASELQGVMRELDGDHLVLDITAKDAPQRIARHLKEQHGGVDVVVHNAGITRDKKLANMARADEGRPVRAGDRGQPDRARADHPRAARPGRRQRGRLDRRRRLDRGHRRQRRADQLRRLEGRRDRPGRLARRRAEERHHHQRRRARASSSPR